MRIKVGGIDVIGKMTFTEGHNTAARNIVKLFVAQLFELFIDFFDIFFAICHFKNFLSFGKFFLKSYFHSVICTSKNFMTGFYKKFFFKSSKKSRRRIIQSEWIFFNSDILSIFYKNFRERLPL